MQFRLALKFFLPKYMYIFFRLEINTLPFHFPHTTGNLSSRIFPQFILFFVKNHYQNVLSQNVKTK